MDGGNEKARTAFDVFVYRVAKYIGSYVAALNGVDVIAFTAGVGENDHKVREDVCKYLGYLGVTIDLEKNKARGKEVMLTTPESTTKVCIIPTNEELAIARETVSLV
jgi:acetate kinase